MNQQSDNPETTRVRIKVLLNAEGKWAAYGWTNATDGDQDEVLYDMMSGEDTTSAREFWVSADLELPQPIEIEGETSDA